MMSSNQSNNQDKQTLLAEERTSLARQRTILAYVRTILAIILFGMTLEQKTIVWSSLWLGLIGIMFLI